MGSLSFACPACGGAECTSAATQMGELMDSPVLCSGCGARATLLGMRAHVGVTVALMAVAFVCYFSFGRQLPAYPLLGYVFVAALAAGVGIGERFSRRKLLRWQLGVPAAGKDETSLGRSLRRNWMFLVGAASFGPGMFFLDRLHGVPTTVYGILFFASLGPAIWPVISGRAPFEFWAVALALWMASGFVFMILSHT